MFLTIRTYHGCVTPLSKKQSYKAVFLQYGPRVWTTRRFTKTTIYSALLIPDWTHSDGFVCLLFDLCRESHTIYRGSETIINGIKSRLFKISLPSLVTVPCSIRSTTANLKRKFELYLFYSLDERDGFSCVSFDSFNRISNGTF